MSSQHSRRQFLEAVGAGAAAASASRMVGAAEGQRESLPNVLVIVADDVGWADVGYHDSEIRTPNTDRLAAEGVKLERHYVAPMCTPTRVALLTGRYWSRFGNTAPSNARVLPYDTVTLASALQSMGYDTCITGKWHLGSKPQWGPRKFGFNHSHGSLAGGVTPYTHLYKPGQFSVTWHRNEALIEEEGHVTDLITGEAVRYIEMERPGPFFVYVPFTAAHTPCDEPEDLLAANAHIHPDRRQYAASVTHMDRGIGEMVDALERTGQRENTLIVFFSDNGGSRGDDSKNYPDTQPTGRVFGLNHPLRGWKGQVYEGGIRTPACVNWPGRLKPAEVDAPLHAIDWMPTLCGLGDYTPPGDLRWDGTDIWPVLTGESDGDESRVLYCKAPRGRAVALHEGDWKLIRFEEGERVELYRLAEDPNETTDVAGAHPDRVQAMLRTLAEAQATDDSSLPTDPEDGE
ncbi:MAG: sulfatase-like hydrolase/transferase [Armatimonadota bacterium]|jgi:arylsulfatase A-like enzyme